ncbi:DUF6600 domain-containing protein [Runella sp.]|uniref:DUF6600 domain-containing protein n=1 Tax=Runella sp. TaxID=1960881 RepID=UPI0026202023|nr:DUF6600 domain-containing protein [Runella sp.]
MKTSHKINAFFLILFLAIGGAVSQKAFAQPGVGITRQDFYNELSPYGQWLDNPTYGQVWQPQVNADFQPYATDGHWEMTEYGNTWVSDYPWGWAPFHYGRWQFDDYYGWIWIPGYEWGPAWVSWRSGGGYYGWAPLGPGMNIDVNINIPYNYWVFVPDIYITSPRVYSYCIPRNRIVNIYGGTSYLNNYYRYNNRAYAYGPQRHDIERITRNRINVYRADDLYRNGRNNYNRNNGGYAQGPSRGNGGYNSRPDYNNRDKNNRDRWDNRSGQNSPQYDNRYGQNQNRGNDRFDNNSNSRDRVQQSERANPQPNRQEDRSYQTPDRANPQPNRQEDRPYQAPERGNAQRTWGNPPSQGNREQPAQRPTESRESAPRRTWSDNGNSNQQPQERVQPRSSDNGNQQQRANRDYSQQRSQESSQRRQSERSNEEQNRPERRGRN